MTQRICIAFVLKLLLLCSQALWASTDSQESTSLLKTLDVKLFKAVYKAEIRGYGFTGIQELKQLPPPYPDAPDTYEFSFYADASVADIDERTVFTLENNTIKPSYYDYYQKILFFKRKRNAIFNWDEKTIDAVVKGKKHRLPIEHDSIQSRLSYQLQIQFDALTDQDKFDYHVLSKTSFRHYHFQKTGEEIIETPLGRFNTIVMERIYEPGKDRATKVWLAKDYNNLIVKMIQREGDESSSLRISSATFDGQPVTGL